jgi:hypothetical protein
LRSFMKTRFSVLCAVIVVANVKCPFNLKLASQCTVINVGLCVNLSKKAKQ